MMNILTVEGVAKSYGTRVLFDDVTFAVAGAIPRPVSIIFPRNRSSILDAVFSKVSSMVICRSWMSCAAMKPLSKQTTMKPC